MPTPGEIRIRPGEAGRLIVAPFHGRLMVSPIYLNEPRDARAAGMGASYVHPCPCGHHGDDGADCLSTPPQRARYPGCISGPLLDRLDLHVDA